MHAELKACMWKLLGACMRILPHSGRLGQIYVMWSDAATEAPFGRAAKRAVCRLIK